MAIPVQNPNVGDALRQAFDLKGSVRPFLEEFIVPTVQVGDLARGAPPAFVRHAVARFSQGAVVGQRAVWRFEMPGGMIAVLRRFWFRPVGANGTVVTFFGSSIAPPAGTATKVFTDGRLAGQEPAGVLTFGTQVGNLATNQFVINAVQDPDAFDFRPPGGWVVGSGQAGQFGFLEQNFSVDNTGIDVVLEWDEYQIL